MFVNLKLVHRCFEFSRRAIIQKIEGKRYIRGRNSNVVKWHEKEQKVLSIPVAPNAVDQSLPYRRLGDTSEQDKKNFQDVSSTTFSPVSAIRESQLLQRAEEHDIASLNNEPYIPKWKSSPGKDDITNFPNEGKHVSTRKKLSIPPRPKSNWRSVNNNPQKIGLEYGANKMLLNTTNDGSLGLQGTSGVFQDSNKSVFIKRREKKNVKFPLAGKILPDDVTVENQYQKLSEVVTPLYSVPYDMQLKIKYTKYIGLLKFLKYTLKEKALTKIPGNNHAMACDMTQVRPAPATEAYRNKDEYSIWEGPDGNPKTVGFFVGSPATQVVCIPPDQLINTKESHKLVARMFQEYIRASPHGVCRNFDNSDEGIYRNIIVRSNQKNEVMAIVKIHPKNLTGDQIAHEMSQIRHFFTEGPGQICNINSLYFQAGVNARCTADDAPFHLLTGEPYLYETIMGKSFRISPDAFFQINTAASEVLYTTVLELIQPTPKTVILDLCCGTGAISLVSSHHVGRTVGIEIIRQAVEDAQINAVNNNIKNATFMHGRAEVLLPLVTDELFGQDVVAVINPDRGGVHAAVIGALRACHVVSRIVYISCLPEGNAMRNFVELCKKTSKPHLGKPFTPILASPVDMFPHTNHCELVMLLER